MRCIAIDDEPLALSVLEDYIQRVPYLSLEKLYENPFEALSEIPKRVVDLIFIDINMPGLSGLDLVRTMRKIPQVIFTTAYAEYAIDGFELDATDYLLKPFGFARFLKAVNKANLSGMGTQVSLPSASVNDYVLVQSQHHMVKISLSEIYYIEGFKEYVKIYTEQERPIMTIRSLKSLTAQLDDRRFMRIHRSFIISIDKIQSIRNGKVRIKDRYVPIGESFKEVFNITVIKGRI